MATFRARARALDMLGRQQIAGIPTAISELFKNAHDAYADRVEVDYYRSDGLFVLRDDGLGMTEEEFLSRWLTLGTESKLSNPNVALPPIDTNKAKRPLLGEKGIGRLAIAAIGPQVLVLTRAKRKDRLHDTVGAFIHWGLFECPGIDLDEIEIPVRNFSGGTLPREEEISEMVGECIRNVERLEPKIGRDAVNSLISDLSVFNADPVQIDKYLEGPSLAGDGHGTHFIILPAYEIVKEDIDEDQSGKASPLTKALLGFTNTMTPGHAEPVISTAFRDHKTDEVCDDLIGEREFFTPDEFTNADHHIRGEFDEFGQFQGVVSVYGEEYKNHIISWREGHGERTLCGPFKINLANVQGVARESTVPLEDFAKLIPKMNKFGGLYIYKDGIRILPYGDTDYDWLDIEKNRTKSAGYYHFSYRRIFGVVEINQTDNFALSEKAGREGFRENKAYRHLKSILKNFFEQVTADFFRKEGAYSELYHEHKAELDRLEQARRKRDKLVSEKKEGLAKNLEDFFKLYDAGAPQEDSLSLIGKITKELEVAASISDKKEAADRFLELELNGKKQLANLHEKYRISKPRGIGLSKDLQKEWNKYLSAMDLLQETVFAPANQLIVEVVGAEAEKARLELDRRLRIERVLEDLATQARKMARFESGKTRESLARVEKEVKEVTRESLAEVESVMKDVFSEFSRLDVTDMKDERVVKVRNELETRIIKTKDEEQKFLQYVRTQLESIDFSDDFGQLDQMEALEQRSLALEEQADADLQLTQLGMAIEVINHEFDGSVKSIRDNLRHLKAWADVNEDLEGLYQNIRTSFDHLDGYLTLFTPLHRRLYRQEIEFSGADIHKFLEDLFRERLRRHKITIEPTKSFLQKKTIGYPSSFYPVFVNLIDNALFWLKDQPQPRLVKLTTNGDSFVVSDTGPGIPERDHEDVFELGFSRKPGGRGMGLHISREVLQRAKYTLSIMPSKPGQGATFKISPKENNQFD